MSDSVPIDEGHRFLRWLPKRYYVEVWERWLSSRGVPHVVVQGKDGWWSIYKHLWSHSQGQYCCEPTREA